MMRSASSPSVSLADVAVGEALADDRIVGAAEALREQEELRRTCRSPEPPIIADSFAITVRAAAQPPSISPSTFATGTRTSSKNTSLKCAAPVAWIERAHLDARTRACRRAGT